MQICRITHYITHIYIYKTHNIPKSQFLRPSSPVDDWLSIIPRHSSCTPIIPSAFTEVLQGVAPRRNFALSVDNCSDDLNDLKLVHVVVKCHTDFNFDIRIWTPTCQKRTLTVYQQAQRCKWGILPLRVVLLFSCVTGFLAQSCSPSKACQWLLLFVAGVSQLASIFQNCGLVFTSAAGYLPVCRPYTSASLFRPSSNAVVCEQNIFTRHSHSLVVSTRLHRGKFGIDVVVGVAFVGWRLTSPSGKMAWGTSWQWLVMVSMMLQLWSKLRRNLIERQIVDLDVQQSSTEVWGGDSHGNTWHFSGAGLMNADSKPDLRIHFHFVFYVQRHAYLHGHNSASANDGKLAWTHISILSLWVHLKQRFPRGCQFLNVSQMFLEISPSSSQGSQNFLSQLSLAAFIYWEPQPWAIIPALVFMLPTQTGKLVLFWGWKTEANTRH